MKSLTDNLTLSLLELLSVLLPGACGIELLKRTSYFQVAIADLHLSADWKNVIILKG